MAHQNTKSSCWSNNIMWWASRFQQDAPNIQLVDQINVAAITWWLPFIVEALCTLHLGQLAQSRAKHRCLQLLQLLTVERYPLIKHSQFQTFNTKSEKVHFHPFRASSSSGWKLTGNSSRLLPTITSPALDFKRAAVLGTDFSSMFARFRKAS